MKKRTSTLLPLLVFIALLCVFLFSFAACSNFDGNNEQKPYYGTYQNTGEGNEIVINRNGFTWGNTVQYTYDDYNKEIYLKDNVLKFKLFNNYTILAATAVRTGNWTSFDFEDYGDGTIYLKCLRMDSNYSLKELLTVHGDGTFSYFSAPLTRIDGTYRYKDRYIDFSSNELGGGYIGYDKAIYHAVWIKDYQNFWNGYSQPENPIKPDNNDTNNKPSTATVQFVNDSKVYQSQTVALNTIISEPPAISKPDSVFLGWYIDNNKIEFPYTVTGNITFVAKWHSIYTCNFKTEQGGILNGTTTQRIEEGTTSEPITAVANDGYVFSYWKYNVFGIDYYFSDPTITIDSQDFALLNTGSITYTAVFKKITYEANYSCVGGYSYGMLQYDSISDFKVSFQISIDNNFTAPQITAVPNQGYRFVKWSDGVTTATRHDTNISSDINITAQFVRVYNVKFEAETGGSIVGNLHQTVDEGEKTSAVTAVADDGYEFFCWCYTEYGIEHYYWSPIITIDSKDFQLLNNGTFTYTAVFQSK